MSSGRFWHLRHLVVVARVVINRSCLALEGALTAMEAIATAVADTFSIKLATPRLVASNVVEEAHLYGVTTQPLELANLLAQVWSF